jgi:MFS family permease
MIGATLGNITGYIIAASIQDNIGWRWAFYIQSIMLGATILSYYTIPAPIVNLRKTTPLILEYQKKPKPEKVSIRKGMGKVLCNGGFLRMGLSVTLLYFVVTGIQFWFSDFLITVMNLEKEVVFSIFGFVSISGPVFGVIFGGVISSKLGGYNNTRSLYWTAAVSVFSVFMAVPIPFLGDDKVWV